MDGRGIRLFAVVAAVAVTGGIAAGIAGAGDVATFGTRVTISERAPAFHGRVKSDSDDCVADRKVKLLRRKRRGRPARILGTDRTTNNGRWAITEPADFTLKSGIYFARAPRVVIDTPVPTVCAKDRSRKLVVD
jgi:hypothetical protein